MTTAGNKRSSAGRSAKESGAVVLLVLGLMSVLLALSVLVIDLSRIMHTLHSMQKAADAAALAGAAELVFSSHPDLDRWKNSKRVVLAILKQNPIFGGYQFPNVSRSADRRPPADGCESTGDYSSGIYDNGSIRIEIERGVYREEEVSPFTSSERADKCSAEANPAPNAVRVRLSLFGFYVVFGKMIGQERIGSLTVTGLSGRVGR